MASKRKSSRPIPCMVSQKSMRLRDDLEQESLSCQMKDSGYTACEEVGSMVLGESSSNSAGDSPKDVGLYTCRPCNFETQDLNLFLDHVYSGHPEFRADPSFHCVECGVTSPKFEGLALHNARVHPSTVNTALQLRKKDRKATVEQSLIIGPSDSHVSKDTEISITKTPIMKRLKGKSEPKRIVVSHCPPDESGLDAVASSSKLAVKKDPPAVTVTHVPTIVHNGAASKVTLPSAIQIVNGSGALLKTAITQVVSVVQNRSLNQQSTPITMSSSHSSSSASSSKNLPKVMIPLSSIPTYNAAMDSSSFLKTSFSKFPYPTKAELCYLTVVTKYPEEQIKIWFTAQRLKQGISWSPEEIEDARRKMFNTIIQTAPPAGQQQSQPRQPHSSSAQPTITVLPASIGATGIPHILQGSLVGQGGVIVTQPMLSNGIQVSSAPVALAVTPKPQTSAKAMMPARPAAALVADKGMSMVVGTVGSSSSVNYSGSGGGGKNSTSSASSSVYSSASSVISSLGTCKSNNSASSSQTSVISVTSTSIGKNNGGALVDASSNTSKLNNISTDSKSTTVGSVSPNTNTDTKSGGNGRGVSNTAKASSDVKNADAKTSSDSSPAPTTTTAPADAPTDASTTTATISTGKTAEALSALSPSASSCASSRTLPSGSFLDPSFYKNKKSQEQLSALKQSFLKSQFPNQEEVERLTSLTGLTVREVRKWFSDRRYHFRNLKGSRSTPGGQSSASDKIPILDKLQGSALDLSDSADISEGSKTPQQSPISPTQQHQQTTSPTTPSRRPPRPPSPDFTAIRYKEREPHQVRALESSFAQDPVPPAEEVDRLRQETKMTRREIHGWFSDRRKRVAAEKKREEAERAEKEEEEEEEDPEKDKSDPVNEDPDEKVEMELEEISHQQGKEETSGTEPKVNPIKINLKMLKVTESNGKGECEGNQIAPSENPKTPTPFTQSVPTPPLHAPSRGKKTADQLHLLKLAFARTPWPGSPQYDDLMAKTGLPRPEVVRWFGDCRYVLKNGQLKWLESYQNMVEEEDFEKGNVSVLKDHLNAHGKLDANRVMELSQSSGLNEDLVRRWFGMRAPQLLGGEKIQEDESMESAKMGDKTEEQIECTSLVSKCESGEVTTDEKSSNPNQGTD
ncbi:zinc fingers and homeoboxes protein 3 [Denticeps clupeoides]|uniref:Homeobox domain-containing protein n=1 Tax=Denticeps clupeoides TaxID=299321 RepID=A0AAY4CRH4_9TELE|nr:zinc fingers and homeoboxes protein 3-like [Denticeps clupeoides]XP_028848886.1 zinc fingers and homeoboxes protein 3-like [Denticeps clupeoides]